MGKHMMEIRGRFLESKVIVLVAMSAPDRVKVLPLCLLRRKLRRSFATHTSRDQQVRECENNDCPASKVV